MEKREEEMAGDLLDIHFMPEERDAEVPTENVINEQENGTLPRNCEDKLSSVDDNLSSFVASYTTDKLPFG